MSAPLQIRVAGPRAGFSLIEVLVALVILLMAFTIIWSTFTTTVSAWRRGSDMMDRLHRGDFVMEQLVTSMRSMAFFSTKPEAYGFQLKDRGSGEDSRDQFSWVTSGTAFIPPDSPYAEGLHRIEFTIEDNRDGAPAVAIRAWPHLAETDRDDVEPWYVSTEVKGVDCKVYVPEDEDWSDEWEDTNAIPRLVHVTLYMAPIVEYGPAVKLERLIEVPVAPPLIVDVSPVGLGGGGEGQTQ